MRWTKRSPESLGVLALGLVSLSGCITYGGAAVAPGRCNGAPPRGVAVIVRPVEVRGRSQEPPALLWDAASELAARFAQEGIDARVYSTLADAPADRITLESYQGERYTPLRAVPVNLAWVLSFGLVPKFGSVQLGHHFLLRSSRQAEPVEVVAHERVRYAVGWLVGPWIWLTGAPRGVPRPSNPRLLTDALSRALGERCDPPPTRAALPARRGPEPESGGG